MTIPNDNLAQPGELLGLLAGGGQFPIMFAKAARAQGYRIFCMGVAGMVDDELAEHCNEFHRAPLGRVGKAIGMFKSARVRRAIMAGKIEKTLLYQKWGWIRNIPDWRALHLLFRYAMDRKDDTLLLAVIKEFERDNIQFESALDYCPELLVKHGFLTKRKPSPAQWRDIRFGWELAKEMGRLDVGQTVVVSDRAVMAVEAIEGTDKCIRRAGELCKQGFTVVKVAKPQQDRRFDVPTVGTQTIHSIYDSGGKVLAIESGQTIMLEEQETLDLANKLGIAIVSLNAEEVELRISA